MPARSSITDTTELQRRVSGDPTPGTLLYLPGLHGDWTLIGPFRRALANRARLVEISYPRRPDWTLPDYARAVEAALRAEGIEQCWILGESFSSQVAWALLDLVRESSADPPLAVAGLILVGGFVRHPWHWGVGFARRASAHVPAGLLRAACRIYGWAARRRCSDPEIAGELREFVARRLTPSDRRAMTARYVLLQNYDPRPIARVVAQPVFQFSGAWDPLVPWWQVRPWLRRHCPGYRASRILWNGGHNILLSTPRVCAEQILHWIGAKPS